MHRHSRAAHNTAGASSSQACWALCAAQLVLHVLFLEYAVCHFCVLVLPALLLLLLLLLEYPCGVPRDCNAVADACEVSCECDDLLFKALQLLRTK